MELNHQTNKRGVTVEDRWREVFDKVFAELRTDHPADEWTIRIVDQLPLSCEKNKLDATSEPNELLDTEAVKEAKIEEAPIVKEVAVDSEQTVESIQAQIATSEIQDSIEKVPIESSETVSSPIDITDTIELPDAVNLDEDEQLIQEEMSVKEPLTGQVADEPVATDDVLDAQHRDCQVEHEVAEPECQPEQAVPVHSYEDARGEDTAQSVDQGQASDKTAEALLDEPATTHGQISEDVVKANDDCPNETLREEVVVNDTPDSDDKLEPIADNQREVQEDAQKEPVQTGCRPEEFNKQENLPGNAKGMNDEIVEPDVGSVQAVSLLTPPDDLEPVTKPPSAEQPDSNSIEVNVTPVANEPVVDECETATNQVTSEQDGREEESHVIRMYAETHFISATDLPRTDMDVEPPMIEVALNNHEERQAEPVINGEVYDEPEKQIDELEVRPAQLKQDSALLDSGIELPDKKTGTEAGNIDSARKTPERPPTSPTKKTDHEEHSRKPEWMRRPLVRKGSVGRFLGRMKETMQSKRFHQDRLPVVPPPLPDPPKRPPRRKTLHNLDLTRESLNTSTEQSQTETTPLMQTPPPAGPQSNGSAETDNRSGTLRSTTSERRRKNSVGRFFGKVLSNRQANQSESTIAVEETPLLPQDSAQEQTQQQTEAPSVTATPGAATPTRSVSPTPVPSEKSKKITHTSINDVSQYIRRILRPKTPTHDELKSSKHAPERPPPPHPLSNEVAEVDGNGAETQPDSKKPIIKQGRVHFKCQKCHHQWRSARGLARFEIVVDQVGNGICHGEVLVRLFGQQCNRCPVSDAPEFEIADWNVKEVEKALTELLTEVSRRHYPGYPRRPETDERGRRAHQRLLCQACQEGVCQI